VAAAVGPLVALLELGYSSYRHRHSDGSWLRRCLTELKTALRAREISTPADYRESGGPAATAAGQAGLRSPQLPPTTDKTDYQSAGEDSVRERLLYRKVEEDRLENSRL
jgi:hypothetical protein